MWGPRGTKPRHTVDRSPYSRCRILQFEGMLDFHRDRGISEGVGFALLNLGQARYRLGDYARATEEFGGARRGIGDVGFRVHVGHALQGEAASIVRLGAFEQAARLLGRAALKLEGVGASFDDFDRSLPDDAEALARATLGNERFERAYQEGFEHFP